MKNNQKLITTFALLSILGAGFYFTSEYLDKNKQPDASESINSDSNEATDENNVQTLVEKTFKNDKGEYSLTIQSEGVDSAKLVVLDSDNKVEQEIVDSKEWEELSIPGATIVVGDIFAYVTNENVAEGIPSLLLVDLYSYRIFKPDMEDVFTEAFSKMESNGMYGSQIVGFEDNVTLKIKRTDDSASYTSLVSLPDFKVGTMELEK